MGGFQRLVVKIVTDAVRESLCTWRSDFKIILCRYIELKIVDQDARLL